MPINVVKYDLKNKWPKAFAAGLVIAVLLILATVNETKTVYGMYTLWGWAWYATASILVTLSYHLIPNALDTLRQNDNKFAISDIATSTVFTLFVRVCGTDHTVMLSMMFGHGYLHVAMKDPDHWIYDYTTMERLHNFIDISSAIMMVSIWAVCLISMLSAYAVYTTSKKVAKNRAPIG